MSIYSYESAAALKAKKKRRLIVIVSILVLAALTAILLPIIMRSTKYKKAMDAIDAKDYAGAYDYLSELGDYKDCQELRENIQSEYHNDLISLEVGDTFYLGDFEQDGNTSNGAEAVEWIILAKEDSRLFAISKYALDCQPYHSAESEVTWETCTLRAWLNEDFYNTTFDTVEQSLIIDTTVSADKNPVEPEPNPGNETTDKVFLLSINEAETYLSQEDRIGKATDYAKDRGAHVMDSTKGTWWWLRTPGYAQQYASFVYSEGSVSYRGHISNEDCDTVRPAMWLEIR